MRRGAQGSAPAALLCSLTGVRGALAHPRISRPEPPVLLGVPLLPPRDVRGVLAAVGLDLGLRRARLDPLAQVKDDRLRLLQVVVVFLERGKVGLALVVSVSCHGRGNERSRNSGGAWHEVRHRAVPWSNDDAVSIDDRFRRAFRDQKVPKNVERGSSSPRGSPQSASERGGFGKPGAGSGRTWT
jgi:hypothetical protein